MIELDLKSIFNTLPGTWLLERHIQFPEYGGRFFGTCEFKKLEDGRLLCDEKGQLTINGHTNDANRSYIYVYQDGEDSGNEGAEPLNDKIVILYNDSHRTGDVLHELEFQAQDNLCAVAHHCHECGQDTYDLTFTISSDNQIDMKYVIKGPHKDYSMQSTLTRSPKPDQS